MTTHMHVYPWRRQRAGMRIWMSWHVNGIGEVEQEKNLDLLTLGQRLDAGSRRYDNQQGQAKSVTSHR